MIRHIPIILLFCISSAERLKIETDKVAVFNVKTKQHFLLNNRHYRESINPTFTLNLRKGEYYVTSNNIKLFNGRANYGTPYLQNRIIKPHKPLLVSKVDIISKKDSQIYILATAYNVYPVKNNYRFTLYYNNKPLYTELTNSFEYFTVLKAIGQFNSFSLYVEAPINACLCPTIGTGYNSGYQLATWENPKEENSSNMVNSRIIKIPIASEIKNNENMNKDHNINKNQNIQSGNSMTHIKLTIIMPKNNDYNHSIRINADDLPIDYYLDHKIIKRTNNLDKLPITVPNIFSLFYKYLDIY